jgi:hypothetical protein
LTANGYAFINHSGKIVSKIFYSRLNRFSERFAVAKIQSQFFYLDKALNPVLGPFENADSFQDEVAFVVIDEQDCFINRNGEVLFRSEWDWVSRCCFDGRIGFSSDAKNGFLDRAGNVAIQPVYDEGGTFSEQIAFVKKGSQRLAVNLAGGELFKIEADEVQGFREGLAAYQVGQKWGYIDNRGITRIKPKFTVAGPFSQGLAAVAVGD